MAVVTQLLRGKDGKVCSCQIRTSSGTILRRPVQLLYHLETPEGNVDMNPRGPNGKDVPV